MKAHSALDHHPDPYHGIYSKTLLGFWIYLLSDFVFFGSLFATYAVLHKSVFGGPSPSDLFSPPFILTQTLILLTSSFTIGLGGAFVHRKNKRATLNFFGISFILGLIFMIMEIKGFHDLIQAGHGWQGSAFLSAYFTLIATHGIHILLALLWVPILLIPVWREGITNISIRRLSCLKMFWQFLNIVWIFIFSFVYLMGVRYD